jgi:multiple sugar transport system permease protein
MMAGAVITVLPVLALFVALQRYYMQGLLMGSVK